MELRGNWLTAGALWVLAGASAALNAWGWSQVSDGFVTVVLVALVLVAEVLGIRLAVIATQAFEARAWARGLILSGFFGAAVSFNAYSGHRAFEIVESRRVEAADAGQADERRAMARVAALRGELESARAALASVPTSLPARRLEVAQAPHVSRIERLESRLDDALLKLEQLPDARKSAPPIEPDQFTLLVLFMELLKALGLWSITFSDRNKGRSRATGPVLKGKELLAALLASGEISRADVASAHAGARWGGKALKS
jgi:hypothetical protein